MQRKTSLLGVLMCGGKSTRMGRDKGLIPFLDKTWASLGAEKLSALGIPVAYAINPGQASHYLGLLNERPPEPWTRSPTLTTNEPTPLTDGPVLIMDDPDLPVGGPLLGLLSVHRRFPEEVIFLLACDLPFMEEDVLQELLKAYGQNPGYDAYQFGTQEAPEPVCAIYKASALENITGKEGGNSSLKYWLAKWNVLRIPIPAGKEHCFSNINTPEEWGS